MKNGIRRVLAGALLAAALAATCGVGLAPAIQADGPGATYTYDARGRLTRVEYADGSVVEYAYDAAGNITTHNLAPAAAAFDLAAEAEAGALTLSWQHLGGGVLRYEVYRSTIPYFAPGDAGAQKLADVPPPAASSTASYSDLTAFDEPLTGYFYLIRAIGSSGQPLAVSQSGGTFHFTLQPGA